MRAVAYCRVSTKEQAEQGYSLESQERECRKFAQSQGFEIDRVFVERGESAKTQDRTELKKLIKYGVENKKNLSALIIWKYDRLARNMSDQMELVKNFAVLGIRVLSVTENNEDTSVGKLMRNIIGSFSQYENDVKSERTRNAMRQMLLQGRWCWKAHTGYRNAKDEFGKATILITDESKFVLEGFELFASGLYKQVDLAAFLRRKGFEKATKGFVNRMLRNYLYAGMIKVEWHPDIINALHEPIVSKETFFKVQAILDGKRPSITPRKRNNPDFPLRNFIRCPKCGKRFTGSWVRNKKKARATRKYPWYWCKNKGCGVLVKREDLQSVFYEYLKSFQPIEETLALFEVIILDVWRNKQSERIKEEHRIEGELKALGAEQERVEELAIKGTFDDETYKKRSQKLKTDIMIKKIELSETRIELNDTEACLNYAKFFMANVGNLWASAELDLKQRIQQLVFPDGVVYDQGICRTDVISPIFRELRPTNSPEYQVASPTGFEPVLLE